MGAAAPAVTAGLATASFIQSHRQEKKARKQGRIDRAENAREKEGLRQEKLGAEQKLSRERSKTSAGVARSLRSRRGAGIFGNQTQQLSNSNGLKTTLGG